MALTRLPSNRKAFLDTDGLKLTFSLLESTDSQNVNFGLQLVVNFDVGDRDMRSLFVESGGLELVLKVLTNEVKSNANPANKRLSLWVLLNLNLDGSLNDLIRMVIRYTFSFSSY